MRNSVDSLRRDRAVPRDVLVLVTTDVAEEDVPSADFISDAHPSASTLAPTPELGVSLVFRYLCRYFCLASSQRSHSGLFGPPAGGPTERLASRRGEIEKGLTAVI